jgi:hypothetical protein
MLHLWHALMLHLWHALLLPAPKGLSSLSPILVGDGMRPFQIHRGLAA